MSKPKYSINDVLRPKLDSTGLVKLHVVGVKTLELASGFEISYQCRVYTERFKGSPPAIPASLFEFYEPEVEEWKEIG